MTNYQKLCSLVDIYEAGNNRRFYDALADAGLNEAVNHHIFYPNDEAMVDFARIVLPVAWEKTIIQSCDDRWYHVRTGDWEMSVWIYCPPQCELRIPTDPKWINGGGVLTRGQVFAALEKEYVQSDA